MPKPSVLIVGQGLAGTVLALTLIQKGCPVMVVDNGWQNSSSWVAAGMYNPITGKRMVKTWQADKLFDHLNAFYTYWEKRLSTDFLFKKTIYRPFSSVEEKNDWLGKSATEGYQRYIGKTLLQSSSIDEIIDPHGGVDIAHGGYLDIPAFLRSCRSFFERTGRYARAGFLFQSSNDVWFRNTRYDKLIFATGIDTITNSPFQWLPFKPVKGEVLHYHSEMLYEKIFNKGVFLLSHHDGYIKCGSTYESVDLTLEPTIRGKNQIEEKKSKLITKQYELVDHKVGIRPATLDRRPFVGFHPELKNVGIFNGLGAKGVSLAPYIAKKFVDHMLEGKILDNEINISRYISLYFGTANL